MAIVKKLPKTFRVPLLKLKEAVGNDNLVDVMNTFIEEGLILSCEHYAEIKVAYDKAIAIETWLLTKSMEPVEFARSKKGHKIDD